MAKTIDLEKEIGKILQQYGDNLTESIKEVTKKVARAGVKSVKANSQSTFGGTGKYAAGWTSRVEEGRFSAQGILYNKSLPGLPHLLEHGHAMRGGGRSGSVDGREHIAPVERELIKQFEDAIVREI